jgi:replication factor C small subunit
MSKVQLWTEKYRPTKLDQVVGNEETNDRMKSIISEEAMSHIILCGNAGLGKCLHPDTEIIMADGTKQAIKNVKPGQQVMGDDWKPRNVIGTCVGSSDMFIVHQSNAMNYTVNDCHVLSLINQQSRLKIDIDLPTYLQMDDEWKNSMKGYRITKSSTNGILNVITSDIRIVKKGLGNYAGFELDGNGRFLLSDYTVTHNTSSMTAMAKEMYGVNYKQSVLESNASSDRRVEDLKGKVADFVMSRKLDGVPFKLVILDEADALTQSAQSMLHSLMDSGIKTNHTRFALACNDISGIMPSIQNMCVVIRFHPLNEKQIVSRLEYIANCEQVKYHKELLKVIARLSKGDMRLAINYLQTAFNTHCDTNEEITPEQLFEVIHQPHPEKVLNCLRECIAGKSTNATKICMKLIDNGYAVTDVLNTMAQSITEDNLFDNISTQHRYYDAVAECMNACVNGAESKLQLHDMIIKMAKL